MKRIINSMERFNGPNAKVSVIVPIYDSEAYLPMCIESIRNQTYRNLEILLIDDGSTDNSLAICKEMALKDTRIRVIHQENQGVSAARNTGIEVAQGEYLTFVDSDDELLPNGIAVLIKDIETYSADVASASKLYISAENEVRDCKLEKVEDVSIMTGVDALKLSLAFDRRMTSCHGKLFRKKFLFDIRYEVGKKINEDFYFVFQCCVKEPVFIYRNECVYRYYYRDNSVTHTSFNDKYFDMLYFAEKKRKIIEEQYPELSEMAVSMEVSTHLFLLNILCRTSEKKYKKIWKKSVQFVRQNHRNYTSANRFEKRLFWIVTHGLYPLYKVAVRLKYCR